MIQQERSSELSKYVHTIIPSQQKSNVCMSIFVLSGLAVALQSVWAQNLLSLRSCIGNGVVWPTFSPSFFPFPLCYAVFVITMVHISIVWGDCLARIHVLTAWETTSSSNTLLTTLTSILSFIHDSLPEVPWHLVTQTT